MRGYKIGGVGMKEIFTGIQSKLGKTIPVTVMHLLIVPIAYYAMYLAGFKHVLPNDDKLIRFDAWFYYTIVEDGYTYEPGIGNNLAFFPLFPLLWKYSMLTSTAITILNYLLFGFSFILLLKKQKLNKFFLLLLLSFPSFIFFALPYSESLFFLFSSLIIIGYRDKKDVWLYVGLFGASLTRSVCMFFIPAIIISEIFNTNAKDENIKLRITKTLYKLLATLTGFLIASTYMGLATGKWFYFIKIQKYWYREWRLPQFPLTTIYPQRILGLDAITFIFGVIAACFCVKWGYQFLKQKISDSAVNQGVIFSAIFIAGMAILDSCFTRITNNSSNIWSLNRHVMCTPFFIAFAVYLFRDFKPIKQEMLILSIILIAGVYFTGVYQYPTLPSLVFFALFFITFLMIKYLPSANRYFIIYYLIAIFLQIKFYEEFLSGLWIG